MTPVALVEAFEAGELTKGEVFAELVSILTPSSARELRRSLPERLAGEFDGWLNDVARGADVFVGRRPLELTPATFSGIQQWRGATRASICELKSQHSDSGQSLLNLEFFGREVSRIEDHAGFLLHLAQAWPYLRWEQAWPLGRPLRHPGQVFDLADSENLTISERGEVLDWLARHNLTASVPAAPPVVVVREGLECSVWTGRPQRVRLEHLLEDLGRLGDALCSSGKGISAQLAHRWQTRSDLPSADRIALEVGAEIMDPGSGALRAVARMTRQESFDTAELSRTLATIATHERGQLDPELDSLAAEAIAFLDTPPVGESVAHEQGVALASWLRGRLGQSGRVDPERVLSRWGVRIHRAEFPGSFDAVALWDEDGAAVIVNRRGRHARTQAGCRATLAHELCHLLIDRDGALPLAEVLGPGAPRRAEARANAFAAQYLVPRDEIAVLCERDGLIEAKVAVKRIADRYRASWQLVAHQLRNSEATSGWSRHELRALERIARPRR